jgi:uracil-DNA glycosylase family 4
MSAMSSDRPGLPQAFDEALDAVLPILNDMKKSLRATPVASRAALDQLFSLPDSFLKKDPASPLVPIAPGAATAPAAATAPSPASKAAAAGDDGRLAKLAELKTKIIACTRCPHLVKSRTQVVYGVGNPFSELLFVGEAPGEEEDLRGEPFVGKAGQLLTRIIGAMEYTREEIFIANVLKCRPDMPAGEAGNRKPKPAEMATCLPWLREQINLIKPKVIVALGLTAVEGLLGEPRTMREVRGKWLDYHGVPLMPTYHPAYLLRNQTMAEKRKVWEDMLMVLEKLGRPISAKQRGYFLEKA